MLNGEETKLTLTITLCRLIEPTMSCSAFSTGSTGSPTLRCGPHGTVPQGMFDADVAWSRARFCGSSRRWSRPSQPPCIEFHNYLVRVHSASLDRPVVRLQVRMFNQQWRFDDSHLLEHLHLVDRHEPLASQSSAGAEFVWEQTMAAAVQMDQVRSIEATPCK